MLLTSLKKFNKFFYNLFNHGFLVLLINGLINQFIPEIKWVYCQKQSIIGWTFTICLFILVV